MNRLTFKEPDGTWGIKNISWSDIPKGFHGVLCKFKDYEDLGLNPDEIERLIYRLEDIEEKLKAIEKEADLLRRKVKVGTVIQGYRISGIIKDYCIAERINHINCEDYVVWRIDRDGCGVNTGRYFQYYEFAKAWIIENIL